MAASPGSMELEDRKFSEHPDFGTTFFFGNTWDFSKRVISYKLGDFTQITGVYLGLGEEQICGEWLVFPSLWAYPSAVFRCEA